MTQCADSLRSLMADTCRKILRRKTVKKDILETKLKRCMSTTDLTLLGLGHMMGSGIYVVTGTVILNIAGPSAILSYAFSGVIALLLALCYAQFSVNVPKTGSAYVYVYIVAGELLAFITGVNLLVEYIASVASVGRSLSDYLDSLTGGAIRNSTLSMLGVGSASPFFHVDFVSPAAILLLHLVVGLGARATANMNNGFVVLNVTVLLVIIVAGLCVGSVDNITKGPGGFFPYGVKGVSTGTGVLIYAYFGFDVLAVASEETKNPSRTIPIALCATMTTAIVLYCSATFTLSMLVPYNLVTANAAFPQAFAQYGLIWTKYVIGIGATIGLTCSLLGQSYCMSRALYAMSEDGLLFSKLTYVNEWTKTPLFAVVASAVSSAILALFTPVSDLVEIVSIGTLFSLAMMIVCLMKIHYMPVGECPFEIKNPRAQMKDETESNEGKPILDSNKNQKLGNIGKLRWPLPFVGHLDSGRVITVTLVLLVSSLVAVDCLVLYAPQAIRQARWWSICGLLLSGTVSIACLCVLLSYEHNTSFAKFKMPFFPLIQVMALVSSLYIMISLNAVTWLRLLVTLLVAVIFYFAYGIHHSTADMDTEYIELKSSGKIDTKSQPPTTVDD